jgi:hypothetical protein
MSYCLFTELKCNYVQKREHNVIQDFNCFLCISYQNDNAAATSCRLYSYKLHRILTSFTAPLSSVYIPTRAKYFTKFYDHLTCLNSLTIWVLLYFQLEGNIFNLSTLITIIKNSVRVRSFYT